MSFLNPFRGTPSKAAANTGPAANTASAPKRGAGAPLELINYSTDTGKFHLGEEALKVLRGVKGPVGVVAVCGRARQGKSFILNQLLGQSAGFVVAPTHRPCTKGLWMWSSPVERRNADGSKFHLVLLDTEGIDAYDQTGQYSTQIFSLAVLLSSLFVYNQMGGIDEAALDRLSLVTEMTKHVRVRAGAAAGEGETELADFTPAFLWLLRDFYLTLEEEGRKLTPREYLETALNSQSGNGPAVEAKNKIRESIKTLFPNRECFTLVRPMSDESQLTKLETIPPEQMRPQFVEGIKQLSRLIFIRAQPKRLGNQIITGPVLAALAEAYVDAINHGAVPTIATAWQGVAEAECRRAADAAEAAYKSSFREQTASDEAALDSEHQRCMSLARQAYAEGALGEETVKRANEQRFTERLESQYKQYRQQRLASAESECRKLIADITSRLTQMATQNSTTLESLQRELSSWNAAYDSAPGTNGPSKWRLHAEFMQNTYSSIVGGLVQRQEQAAKAERLAAAERARDYDRQLKQGVSRVAELEQQLGAARQELAQERASRQQLQAAQQSQASERAQHQAEVSNLRRQLQQATTNSSSAETAASERMQGLQTRLETAQREVQQYKQQAEAASSKHAVLQMKVRDADQARSALLDTKGKLEVISAQLAEANDGQQAAAARIAELEAQLAAKPAQAAPGPEEMDAEGYGTPDEDSTQNLTPSKMTVAEIKDWLTEHGHENVVWELTQSRAKKPRFVAEMDKVLGRN